MNLLIINLSEGQLLKKELPEKYKHLGGRGLTSTLINDYVPPDCDPLGPDNRLIFAPGLLCGTPMVNTGRLSIGAKSPLTGGIKEANAGGTMAMALARLGYRALIIEGKAPENTLFNLVIDTAGDAFLEEADAYKGARNYAIAEQLLKKYGSKNAISSVGPAGEMMLTSASIQTTDPDGRPCRSAARGGLGAVMGAKGLKAVIISRQGKKKPETSNPEGLKAIAKQFAFNIKKDGWSGDVLPNFGTASILAGTNASGALPTRNARQGRFDGADKIDGDALFNRIRQRGGKTTHKGCSNCVIHCSNVYTDSKGRPVTSALEYETIWAMGAMTCIDDLDAIAALDFLCDDMGLDTMNTGTALAVAMDAGVISFGDKKAAVKAVKSITEGEELGILIGNGPDAVADHYNHHRVPTVKGQSIAGYDPRGMPGMGVTYATSPMGADHTAGFVGGARGSTDMLIQMSRSSQVHMAALDSMGLCMFAQSGGINAICEAVSIITGKRFGGQEWQALGDSILNAEIEFNQTAGLSAEDDRLPAMFHNERLGPMHDIMPYPENDLHGMFDPVRQLLKEKK
jgi:aldehyde:ferredoxin oxidoreductase